MPTCSDPRPHRESDKHRLDSQSKFRTLPGEEGALHSPCADRTGSRIPPWNDPNLATTSHTGRLVRNDREGGLKIVHADILPRQNPVANQKRTCWNLFVKHPRANPQPGSTRRDPLWVALPPQSCAALPKSPNTRPCPCIKIILASGRKSHPSVESGNLSVADL